jgi:hypothetical protein
VRGLTDLVKAEDLEIPFLSETKMTEKEMDWFCWKLNLKNMLVVDNIKRSGGLALFWRNGVDVQLRWKGRYHIDVEVVEDNGSRWRFTRIYGESKTREKENTWKLLRTLSAQSNLPWLCMGEFNEILSDHEKKGGAGSGPGVHEGFPESIGGHSIK